MGVEKREVKRWQRMKEKVSAVAPERGLLLFERRRELVKKRVREVWTASCRRIERVAWAVDREGKKA